MKLHRLELEGFGPFLERQIVDFDAFADDGIFLITGRTGAGKSSVLDGVCYALYGGVPRYDGAERRLRSDHCTPDDPTRAAVEFSAEGRRWRVTRSPEYERPKRTGVGTTKEQHRASLEVFADEGWTGVAARPVDVAARLDEILGLTQQQFLQVILLAQNRFARFLLAKNDERQALLRTLFGTRSFDDYERALDERRKQAHDRLTAEGAEASTLLDEAERMIAELGDDDTADTATSDGAAPGREASEVPSGAGPTLSERVAAVVRAVDRADYRVDTLARERDAAATALDAALAGERAATTLRERQEQRLRARAALERLEADAGRIAARRDELEAAVAAEALRAPSDAVRRTDADVRAAVVALERAQSRAEAGGESPGDDAALRDRDDALTGELARCDQALSVEAELVAAESEIATLERDVSSLEREHDELVARRARVPDALGGLDARLGELAGAVARRDAAAGARDDARARLDAAREAERLRDERDQADLVALVRADELHQAVEAWATLLRRRMAGAAGQLARDLVEGEPCAVCGAREHPHPATDDAVPVTDAEIEAADARKARAADDERLASDAARVARDAHAGAAARAAGESADALTARLVELEAEVATAAAEVTDEQRLRAERQSLVEIDERAAAEAERVSSDLVAQRQRLALATQRAEALDEAVTGARGSFDTVAERRVDAERRREIVRDVLAARSELATRERAAVDATLDLEERLAGSAFDSVDAARTALRDDDSRSRLADEVRAHEAAESGARQHLLELELALVGEPDEPIDVTPWEAAVVAARAAVEHAAAAHASAIGVADRLRALAQRADATHDAVARLADSHAVVARLANTVAGRAPNTHRMTLETFVLAAELEEIVLQANLRLDQMSSGRYRLQHTDALAARGAASGLGLEVMDAFTGQCRPPQSLSGGETFLASLALALGLAEVVTARAGGIRLDTLFIDEGFGSLDDDTLELAMRTLDELRQGGRTVGVISHVAAMKDQLPAQLRVTATPRGPSAISQDAVVAAS